MKKLFLWVLMVGGSLWAKAQVRVVVTWHYEEWSITQDSLNYKYNTGTNQLQYITDNVANNVSTTDIDNQSPNNYIYDKSGNMVADNSQSMSVSWSPYGKILTNTKAGGASLAFSYNAMQQRVIKRVSQAGDTTRTYYIRDAQGNTMGVYTRHNDSVTWREQYIFGSSRLGLYRADTLVNKGLQVISKLYEGKRNYELTNHLGNVMAVINDRKTDSLSGTTRVGYNAVVISAVDYYPFGMAIDSRNFSLKIYRYGFNDKENDSETGYQDYGARMYDPRIGKFLSVDPLMRKYPELTPYQFASNTPIMAIDLDGKEELHYFIDQKNKFKGFEMIVKVLNESGITEMISKSFAENNSQTDMYLYVSTNLNAKGYTSTHGQTDVYPGYKTNKIVPSPEQQKDQQYKSYQNLGKANSTSLSDQDFNFIWKTTFSKGKGAIMSQLDITLTDNASNNLKNLAKATFILAHEMFAHGLKSKSGQSFSSAEEEHLEFYGEEAMSTVTNRKEDSPIYENIRPNSLAGKLKAKIEKYIDSHKKELNEIISKNKPNEKK